MSQRTYADAAEPLDLSALRRDDLLLDRIGSDARSTTIGAAPAETGHDPVERLLVAWVQEARRLEQPDRPVSRADLAPKPRRVLAVRQALVGAAVLGGLLVGGSGVAAAVAGSPLGVFARLQQAVIAAASLDDQPPLLRSGDGASAQHRLEHAREMLAAGDVEGARDVLEDVSALVSGLPDDEQALMRDDLSAAQRSASGGERAQPSATPSGPGTAGAGTHDTSEASGSTDDDRSAEGSGERQGQAPTSSVQAPPSAAGPTGPPTSQATSPPPSAGSATSSHNGPAPPPSASGSPTAEPTEHGPPQDPPGKATEKPKRPMSTHSPIAS